MIENFLQIEHLQRQFRNAFSSSYPDWEWTLLSLFLTGGFRYQTDHWIQFNGKKSTSFQNPLQAPLLRNHHLQQILEANLTNAQFQYFKFFFKKSDADAFFWSTAIQARWKQIPLSSMKSLMAWSENKYSLVLYSKTLSPLQMSQLQSQGKRAVTVFETADELCQIHEHHRDAYLFTVHDLEHADHFFSSRQNYDLQTKMSQLIQRSFLSPGPYRDWISHDFLEDYHYLISDMNAHPWHLYLTLQTLLLKSHKIQAQKDLKSPLDPDQENLFQNKIKTLMTDWKMTYPPRPQDFQTLFF